MQLKLNEMIQENQKTIFNNEVEIDRLQHQCEISQKYADQHDSLMEIHEALQNKLGQVQKRLQSPDRPDNYQIAARQEEVRVPCSLSDKNQQTDLPSELDQMATRLQNVQTYVQELKKEIQGVNFKALIELKFLWAQTMYKRPIKTARQDTMDKSLLQTASFDEETDIEMIKKKAETINSMLKEIIDKIKQF